MQNIDSLNIFTPPAPCPSEQRLQLYFHNGMLPQNEWHIENHLLTCETCSKWLENYEKNHSPNLANYLENIIHLKLQLQRLGLEHISTEQFGNNSTALLDFLAKKNCQPIRGYETIIAQKTRSSATEIESPNPLGSFVNKSIQFTGSKTYTSMQLHISNNQLTNIYDAPISNPFTLNLTPQTFPDGLYYYKLMDEEEELLTVGKFYVYRE